MQRCFHRENGCSAKTGRIIKTGAKTGLDYKGSTGGRNTLMKLENKWKLLLKRQFRKEKILLNKECSFELKLNSFLKLIEKL